MLRRIGQALARPLDELSALRTVHAELSRTLDTTIAFFGHFDAESESVEVIWQSHDGVELSGGHFPLGNGPTSAAIRTCQPQLIRHWSTNGPSVHLQYATERPSLPEPSVVVPVLYGGNVRGILSTAA